MRAGIVLRSSLILPALAFWVGCSSSPESSRETVLREFHRSRDGRLRYVTPTGWFDASADSLAAGHAVWIIRNDYGATMTIDEVRLDAAAQATVREGGLEQVARLLMTLPSGDRPVRSLGDPETFERNGTVYCNYTVEVYETRDMLRVVLFRADGRIYASTLVVPAGVREYGADTLLEAQDAFLGSVIGSSL